MNSTSRPRVSVRLLGTPAVLVDGEPLRGLPKKLEALLFLLAASKRAWRRPDLAEMLWGDREDSGRQSLRTALTKVPQSLLGALARDAESLGLAEVETDLSAWLTRCAETRRLAAAANADAARLDTALGELAGWPGPLLEGFEIDAPAFDDWCYVERQRVLREWQTALLAAAAAVAPTGHWDSAEPALNRLLELDPANETAHRGLIQCYLATGRQEAARGQYELCKRQLATLLGIKPDAVTQALLHAAAANAAESTPAAGAPASSPTPVAPAAPTTPNNLPRQVNSFVGRRREMREVAELLQRQQLVTLVGTGGIGKTRLALQVAGQCLNDFPDGVWLVDFTPLKDESQLAQQLAIMLSVREEPGQPVIEAIEKFLRERRLLIILDNCEHVVTGAANLAMHLLQAGQHVSVLATSRERLRVAGEATYDLQTLDLPANAAAIPVAELLAHDAVHLFVDRATAARYDFQLSGENAEDIVCICDRIEGIPLAIELAAARVRSLSVAKIAENLIDRFRLPGTGDRGQTSRQQTLEALIDWSYRLLDEKEATLFRRLSIFAGGWTLEAAEAVAAGDGQTPLEITDLLVRLAEKTLVIYDAEPDRYRMLETVRHVARERIDQSNEANCLRERHVRYFLSLAETARPHLAGADQASWLAQLDAERENLHAGLARSARLVDSAHFGARFVHSLRPYWLRRGLVAFALDAATQVLTRPGMGVRDKRRCEVLFNAGSICNFSGHWSDAHKHLTECLEIARETGHAVFEAAVLQQLGRTCFELGDTDEARLFLAQGVALAERLNIPREIAWACNSLAQCLRLEGQTGAAEQLYERALAIARKRSDEEQIAIFVLNLAMLCVDSRTFNRAKQMLREALTIAETTGSRPVVQSVIEVCAGLAAANAEWSISARFYGLSKELASMTGLRRDAADEAFLAPLVAKTRQALGADAFAAAEETNCKLSYPEALREAASWLNAGMCRT